MVGSPPGQQGVSKSKLSSPTEEASSTSNTERGATVSHAIGLEDESMAAITAKRGSSVFFDINKPKVRRLEPKWQSHFGNYINNTLLALHKFQAKKQ